MYNPGTEKCKYLIVPMPNKYTNHPVCPSICLTIFLVSSTSPELIKLILMTLYTVEVYNLKMYMKKDNPGLKNIKGDNLQER